MNCDMRRRYGGILLGAVCAGVLLLLQPSGVQAQKEPEKIPDGVVIGNINVGGMTSEEAQGVVDDYVTGLADATFTLSDNQGKLEVTSDELGIKADAGEVVEEALAIGRKGNLIDRFKENKTLESDGYHFDLNLTVDRQKLANLIYDHKSELEIPAEDNRVIRENGQFTYVEGQRGEEVDIVASVYAVEDFLSTQWDGKDNEIPLVVTDSEPRGSKEELAKIQDVLGTFSTNFGSSSYERATNVKNGCSKINQTILYPGEEFSVYETVSPFTQENGYELAGSYANGTTVESFGGGICQVSTTLYNAVIRAELKVTQRFNHSMSVAYVKPSEDAAIAGTYKDFRFVNTLDTPIYIQGYCEGGVITFNIYGEETRPSNREVSFESEVLETVEPETKIEVSGSSSLGSISTSQGSHTGYVAQLWKIVTVDGQEQSREIFNKSTYKASPRVITVGIAGASKESADAIKSAAASGSESKVRDAVSAAKAAAKDAEKETETETETEDSEKKGDKKDDKKKDDKSKTKDSQTRDSEAKDTKSKTPEDKGTKNSEKTSEQTQQTQTDTDAGNGDEDDGEDDADDAE